MRFPIIEIPDFLLTIAIIVIIALNLAPYFPGQDIGSLKIPNLSQKTQKIFKFLGPILLLIYLILFLPIFPFSCITTVFERIDSKTGQREKLNVRQGPGKEYAIIGKVEHGESIIATNLEQGWIEIYKPIKGWVAENRTKAHLDCPKLYRKLSK